MNRHAPLLFVLLIACGALACGGGGEAADAGGIADNGVPSDAGGQADAGGEADAGAPDAGFDAGWPPDRRPVTTVKATLKPKLPLAKQDPSLSADFGQYTMDGPGEPLQVRDDLGTAGHGSGTGSPKSFLYLGHTSDNHLIDFQSPNRLVPYDNPNTPSAYRPQEGFAIALFDRTIRTFNAFSYFRKLDALVVTGDGIDNNQYDEARFVIDTLDGKKVDPDTGHYSYKGADNMCAPVETAGLSKDVPWYYVFGNHDVLMQGNFAVTPRTVPPDQQELDIVNAAFYKKAIGGQSDAKIVCQDKPLAPVDLKPGTVNANPDRREMTHRQVLKEFFNTTTTPAGHGFTQGSIDNDLACYTADLAQGVPVRLVTYESPYPDALSEGYILRTMFDDFLKPELERAKADGVLVIVASHHPSWKVVDKSEVKTAELVALFNSYPNVILHLVGHSHSNSVTPHPSGNDDGLGYWEVQAPSTLDFPQQAHLVELVDEGDGTGSVYVTVFNHDSAEGSVPWRARGLSILDIQTGDYPDVNTGDVTDRNVILKFLIPDEVRTKIAALPAMEVESLKFGE